MVSGGDRKCRGARSFDCTQFCAHHRTLPSAADYRGIAGKPFSTRHPCCLVKWSRSVQVVDSSFHKNSSSEGSVSSALTTSPKKANVYQRSSGSVIVDRQKNQEDEYRELLKAVNRVGRGPHLRGHTSRDLQELMNEPSRSFFQETCTMFARIDQRDRACSRGGIHR